MVQVGEKYGKLTVLKKVRNPKVKTQPDNYFEVQCECGNKFLLRKDYISKRTQCPQCSHEQKGIKLIQRKLDVSYMTHRKYLKEAFSGLDIEKQNVAILGLVLQLSEDVQKFCVTGEVTKLAKSIKSIMDKKWE